MQTTITETENNVSLLWLEQHWLLPCIFRKSVISVQ